jgi:hypothetical protein
MRLTGIKAWFANVARRQISQDSTAALIRHPQLNHLPWEYKAWKKSRKSFGSWAYVSTNLERQGARLPDAIVLLRDNPRGFVSAAPTLGFSFPISYTIEFQHVSEKDWLGRNEFRTFAVQIDDTDDPFSTALGHLLINELNDQEGMTLQRGDLGWESRAFSFEPEDLESAASRARSVLDFFSRLTTDSALFTPYSWRIGRSIVEGRLSHLCQAMEEADKTDQYVAAVQAFANEVKSLLLAKDALDATLRDH